MKLQILVNADTLQPVYPGDTITSFRGEVTTLEFARAPHKPASTGRVYPKSGGEYFPSVFNLKFIEV